MYTDEELHKMYDEAMRRGDKLLAGSIMATAMARTSDSQDELKNLHMMFMGYLCTKQEALKEGGAEHGQHDLTAIDPDAVINL